MLEATKEKMVPRNGGNLSAPGLPSRIGQARNIYLYRKSRWCTWSLVNKRRPLIILEACDNVFSH